MSQPTPPQARTHRPLITELRWFMRLRWLAGLAVILGAVIGLAWLGWYERAPHVLAVGAFVLFYNALMLAAWRRLPADRRRQHERLLMLAWSQVLLDLGCLTLLTVWTGGIESPLRGFFVFHMVFASLLLPRFMAYGSAATGILMLAASLASTRQFDAMKGSALSLLGWSFMLLMTVHLANRITRSLRREHRRVVRQNRRIKAMSAQLRRQQQAMVQHEKMVALGQMAAGVAHEVANPLASMDSVLQLLQRHPERLRPEAANTLREQVGRIHQIVRQMTAFAHPSDGEQRWAPLNRIVRDALEMIRFDPRVKRVRIEKELATEAEGAMLPEMALQQTLINLILNSLDAVSGVTDPVVRVGTAMEEESWALTVSDNGPGILEEHMRRIFEPFFTTKPVGKGTGLGLAISYSLVSKHGGEIDVRSRPGEGATFVIRFPRVPKPAAAPA